MKDYIGSLILLAVEMIWRRSLAVRSRGLECRCFRRRNILPPLRGHRSKFWLWSQVRRWRISFAPCGWLEESGSEWIGKGTNLLTPRSRVVVAVCTVAVRTIPSTPGWTLITRPKRHCMDGTLSSLRTTTVPSRISCLPLSHLLRRVSSLRYSRYHLLQKYCLIWWMRCQLDNRPDGTVLKSRSRKLVSVSPIRKWPGVRTGGSFGSDDMGVSGRELRMASISNTRVWRCSKVNSSVPTTRMRWCLKDFTAASHKPPKCGEFGGLKLHCIYRSARKFCTLSLWSSDCNRVRSSCSSGWPRRNWCHCR